MRVLKSAAVYFGLVFSVGFLLGTIRTLWVVPHLGVRVAELLEMPFMLIAIILVAGYINRLMGPAVGASTRVAVGLMALLFMLSAEAIVGVALQGLSVVEVFTKHDPVSGSVYYLMLGVFAAMPWLLWRYRKSEPEVTP